MQDRAIGAGTITRDGLKDTINECFREAGTITRDGLMDCLREAGLSEVIDRSRQGSHQGNEASPEPSGAVRPQAFVWDGSFHQLPREYRFPKMNTLIAWQHWCCPDTRNGYPPLRKVEARDLSSLNLRKRLSDLRFLMKQVEEEAKRLNIWSDNISVQVANELFERCSSVIHLQNAENSHAERRHGQISWTSHVVLLRRQQKRLQRRSGVLS